MDKGVKPTDVDGKLILTDHDGKPRTPDADVPDMGAYEVQKAPAPKPKFIRGFCRHPGESGWTGLGLDIGDAIYLLRWQFGGFYPEPGCVKACDSNDDGQTNLTDAIYILDYLFKRNGKPPVAPFPALGEDGTADALTCENGIIE